MAIGVKAENGKPAYEAYFLVEALEHHFARWLFESEKLV